MSSRTVSEIGEHALIVRITGRLAMPSWVVVGPGDDAAVIEPERGALDVLTTDVQVEGVHFDRRFVPAEAIGHRALAVNLSDLAAMGAKPRAALLSLILPGDLDAAVVDGILDGMLALAAHHRVTLVGGNITCSPGPLIVDVMATGSVRRRRVLTRGGAKPGDEVFVTGAIGAAAVGLRSLQAEVVAQTMASRPERQDAGEPGRPNAGGPERPHAGGPKGPPLRSGGADTVGIRAGGADTVGVRAGGADAVGVRSGGTDTVGVRSGGTDTVEADLQVRLTNLRRCEERYLRPEPRVRAGLLLGRTRAATACIDLSDGLADGVRQIAAASGVGITLDEGAIPLAEGVREHFSNMGLEPVNAALSGGDDYELLFTVRPSLRGRLRLMERQVGDLPIKKIGVVTKESRLVVRTPSGDRDLPTGFEHFR